MAIADLAALRTQIASWLARSDLTQAQLSLFVTASEADIRNDLVARESEVTATGTITSGAFTAPSDFLYARVLTVDDHVLEFLPRAAYLQKLDEGYTTGYYTVDGTTFRVLGGTDYDLIYVAQITPLAADSSSNWVLENAPDLYLWAGCKYGSVFLKDAQGAQGYEMLYQSALSRLSRMENRARYGGALTIRVG